MKPSPPNRPAPIFFVKATSISMPCAAQRNVSFWHRNWPPKSRELDRDHLAGVRSAEGDAGLFAALVRERGDEEALARDAPFEALHESAARARVHLDGAVHVEHGAGFGADGLAGIEFDLDDLHVVADGGCSRCRGPCFGWWSGVHSEIREAGRTAVTPEASGGEARPEREMGQPADWVSGCVRRR